MLADPKPGLLPGAGPDAPGGRVGGDTAGEPAGEHHPLHRPAGMCGFQLATGKTDGQPHRQPGRLKISCSCLQVDGAHCSLPGHTASRLVTAEDLSHLSQLVGDATFSLKVTRTESHLLLVFFILQNRSNSVGVAFECRLTLPPTAELQVALQGQLQLPSLLAVSSQLQRSLKFLLPQSSTLLMSCDLLSGQLSVTGGPDRGLHPLRGSKSHVSPGGYTCPTGT